MPAAHSGLEMRQIVRPAARIAIISEFLCKVPSENIIDSKRLMGKTTGMYEGSLSA